MNLLLLEARSHLYPELQLRWLWTFNPPSSNSQVLWLQATVTIPNCTAFKNIKFYKSLYTILQLITVNSIFFLKLHPLTCMCKCVCVSSSCYSTHTAVGTTWVSSFFPSRGCWDSNWGPRHGTSVTEPAPALYLTLRYFLIFTFLGFFGCCCRVSFGLGFFERSLCSLGSLGTQNVGQAAQELTGIHLCLLYRWD